MNDENVGANPNSNPMLNDEMNTVHRSEGSVVQIHLIDAKAGQARLIVDYDPVLGDNNRPVRIEETGEIWYGASANIPFRFPVAPSHAALVAQRDRLRDAVRYLNTAYNGEYGDGASTDDVIEATVPPLQPGDLGEGGA